MSAKVFVVGSGIVGLAIAEELSRRGIWVELFERNESPGLEASSAAAGILAPQSEAEEPGPFLKLLLAGYQLFPEVVHRLESATGIDLQFRVGGMLEVAIAPEDVTQLQRRKVWLTQSGLRMEAIDGSQVRKLEPAVDGQVKEALFYPQSAQVDNVRMTLAYRQVLEKRKVPIHSQAPVSRFLVEANRVVGIQIGQDVLSADWVIDSAGSWAGFDAGLPFSIPTVPVKGQMLQYQTPRALFQRVVKSPRAYFVQRGADQLIVGTTLEYVGYDKTVTPEGEKAIRQGAVEISSWVQSQKPRQKWAGLRPGTPDRLPILGGTRLKGFLIASGHFRNGILLAPLTGRLMAEWIIQGKTALDLTPFSVERFS